MKCPSCGYRRQLRDNAYVPRNECPSCGITYAKSIHQPGAKDGQTTVPSHAPGYKSPIDEMSLQQARERVELKLRKQMEGRRKDERHQQTLARAKEIAAAEVRRRKEEWERKQNKPDTPVDEPEDKPKDNIEVQAVTEHVSPEISQEPLPMKDPALPENSADDTLAMEQTDENMAKTFDTNTTWPTIQPEDSPAPEAAGGTGKDEDMPAQAAQNTDHPETISNENHTAAAKDDSHEPVTVVASAAKSAPRQDAVRQDTAQDTPIDPPPVQAAAKKSRRSWLQRAWPVVAWIFLTVGMVGAILSWSTIGHVEAAVGHSFGSPGSGSALPLGLLLGFAYLATGVLGFAFFWVSSTIGRQLKDIRRLLMMHLNAALIEKPE